MSCESKRDSIRLQVNGAETVVEAPATIATLLAARQPRPPFAVELNKALVRRGGYEAAVLRDGDQVEIVTLVGGG